MTWCTSITFIRQSITDTKQSVYIYLNINRSYNFKFLTLYLFYAYREKTVQRYQLLSLKNSPKALNYLVISLYQSNVQRWDLCVNKSRRFYSIHQQSTLIGGTTCRANVRFSVWIVNQSRWIYNLNQQSTVLGGGSTSQRWYSMIQPL